MKSHRRIKIWGGSALLLLVLASGLIASPRGQEKLGHTYERLVFQLLADRITQGAPNPQAAVIRLLEYVHASVVDPPPDKPIGDVEPLAILVAGRGWCDQQANVFIQLARTLPLDGRLVFLLDAGGVSRHSVAEVNLDGEWRVVDPLLGVALLNSDGKLATRQELARNPSLLTQAPPIQTLVRFGSKEEEFPFSSAALYQNEPTVFNTWNGRRKQWLDRLPEPVRSRLMWAFQDLYLALPSSAKGLSQPQRLLLRARHYELLQRPEATGIYEHLTELADDPAVQQDARFFLGRFYQRSWHLEKALEVLQGALGTNPVRGWSSFIHLALGEIYESLDQPARALEEYHLTEKMSHDATVSQRMNSLLLALN